MADPAFAEATGYGTYRTSGQRAAMRAALSMPEDGTLIALLPTGSGKTEIAVTLARLARGQTTIIVVPTVALAYDFERRFRSVFARLNPRVTPEELAFAWTADTDATSRAQFRSMLVSGKLPILITSPESMAGALLHALRAAAEGGRIRALVVDEAHLVTQWGRDFRPEFRQLASLRRELLQRSVAAGHAGFKTLLFSATLGRQELEDLTNLFGEPGPVSLVAANALRAEPEYWVGPPTDDLVRHERVIEGVLRLPRPLLLYVTSPLVAEIWQERLVAEGFRRVAIVTGKTAGQDRRDVLEGLRAGSGVASRFDVVVATSAFGLGIDNDQIRTVVHACLPETVDRWYQEVGRGGRDGNASTALLLPAWGDEEEAASLGVKMLKPDNAERRWATLWRQRKSKEGQNYIDLHATPPRVAGGSYNRRWNAQVLRGLEELKRIERTQLSLDEAAALELPIGDVDEPHEWERVELIDMDVHQAEFFSATWEPWRRELMRGSFRALEGIKAAMQSQVQICHLFAAAYAPGPLIEARFGVAADFVRPTPDCGRCPGCRAVGIMPPNDPPPRVPSRWAVDVPLDERLSALLAAAPTGDQLAVVISDALTADAKRLGIELARVGVMFFAGVDVSDLGLASTVFVDLQSVSAQDVPPLPGFIVPPPGEDLDQAWFVSGIRPDDGAGRPVPVVLLVRSGTRVGARRRALESLATLRVDTAISILRMVAQ